MPNNAKKRKTFKAGGLILFAFCLLWAFLYVKIPDFTISGITEASTNPEREYLLELRKKYSGTQRKLTAQEARAAIDEACAFIETSKNYPRIYDSLDAKELLFGTACTESGLRPRFQDGGGDAIGLFQVEYKTFRDIWDRAIPVKHPDLHRAMKAKYSINGELTFEQLQQSDVICAIFARMKYAESSAKIPSRRNEKAQAEYYKKYYNTYLGKATPNEFIKRKHRILKENQ